MCKHNVGMRCVHVSLLLLLRVIIRSQVESSRQTILESFLLLLLDEDDAIDLSVCCRPVPITASIIVLVVAVVVTRWVEVEEEARASVQRMCLGYILYSISLSLPDGGESLASTFPPSLHHCMRACVRASERAFPFISAWRFRSFVFW